MFIVGGLIRVNKQVFYFVRLMARASALALAEWLELEVSLSVVQVEILHLCANFANSYQALGNLLL